MNIKTNIYGIKQICDGEKGQLIHRVNGVYVCVRYYPNVKKYCDCCNRKENSL